MCSPAFSWSSLELIFGKIDTNKDDLISPEEFNAAYVKYVTLRTAPGLGGELKRKLEGKADALFAKLDADGNGTISREELRSHLEGEPGFYEEELIETIMKGIDTDKSGEIDKDELRKAFMLHPSIRTAKGLGGDA